MHEFKAEEADSKLRADVFVSNNYPKFSRSSLETLFDNKLVRINGITAKPSQKIKAGDKVEVDEALLTSESPSVDLPIIYEDDNVVVIDKPSGVLTHSKGALNTEGTVASFIHSKLNDHALVGNRAGIVHRLDRATSGIIVTAKNADTSSKLQKQFSDRRVKKTYLAIVEGQLEPEEAIIDAPIMRNPAKPQTFKVGTTGKSAITQYKVLKSAQKGSKWYSLVELKPQTGRTHQLRVHMSYINHPIVGDPVYGQGDGNLMLFAQSLEITVPKGERKVFTVSTPDKFNEFFNA